MIWFVGQGSRHYANYFAAHNLKYGLFTDKDRPVSAASSIPVIPVDFTSQESILASLPRRPKDLDGVITIYETYVYGAAVITRHFGLPGMTPQAAKTCSDKILMRQKFLDYQPAITPGFASVQSWSDVLGFIRSHTFPFMLKPANLTKSLLVTKNHNPQELKQNYEFATKTIANLYQKHRVRQAPKLLIEEFLEGSVHSVDGFAGQGGVMRILDQVIDYQTGYDIGKQENYHFSRRLPSRLPKTVQSGIRQVAEQGMKALQMQSSPAHVEVVVTKKGPKIVEIGARLGGYRPRMHSYANRIDLYQANINTALGLKPDITASANKNCAVLELFPDQEGLFTEISNLEKLNHLPSIQYVSIKAKPYSRIGLSSQGYKASIIVMLGNEDSEQFERDYAYVKDKVEVRTKEN